jgi:hypothetical protein
MKVVLAIVLACLAFAVATQPVKVTKPPVINVSNPGSCRNRSSCLAKHQHYHVRSAKSTPKGKS